LKAVRFVNPMGETRIGVLGEDGAITDAGPADPRGFLPTTLGWEALEQADGPTHQADDVRLLHPVVPEKLIAIGLNYRSHAEESELDIPAVPVVFAKFSSSLIGPGAEIVIPREETRPDYEGELAVVIGRVCRDVPAEQAGAYVFGYTCANDVTARDLQATDGQWARAKGFDTFCPLGPWIETQLDPSDLEIRTTVNGEVKQESRTSLLLHAVPALVSYAAAVMTLLPGDVLLTGTPEGVGPLDHGDQVSVTIEGIGTLTNRVADSA
jgi:2-keto-4-pentenoate hydratase/2-oxohepta-3-ene-1,7-dioic acid hydratase in catechol pathway